MRAARGGAALDATRRNDAPGASTPTLVRMLVLSALLLLALYTVFGVMRLTHGAWRIGGDADRPAGPGRRAAVPPTRRPAGLDAALQAAGTVAQRFPASPMDAAETGLKAAHPNAQALAIVGDDGVRAASGDVQGADWSAVAQAARASGRSLWFGRLKDDDRVFAARAIEGGTGRPLAVASASFGPALDAAAHGKAALAWLVVTPEGQVLGARGRGGVDQTANVREALSIAPDALQAKAPTGTLPDGTPVSLSMQPVADGGAAGARRLAAREGAGAGATFPATSSPWSRRSRSGWCWRCCCSARCAAPRRPCAPSPRASSASAWRSRPRAAASGSGTWTRTAF